MCYRSEVHHHSQKVIQLHKSSKNGGNNVNESSHLQTTRSKFNPCQIELELEPKSMESLELELELIRKDSNRARLWSSLGPIRLVYIVAIT